MEPQALSQNEPNPFCGQTKIAYRVERAGRVRLRLYDLMGRHVATLVDAVLEPGVYTATFDGAALAHGLYLYRLETATGAEMRKMMLTR